MLDLVSVTSTSSYIENLITLIDEAQASGDRAGTEALIDAVYSGYDHLIPFNRYVPARPELILVE